MDALKRECEAGQIRFPGQIEELKESSTFKRLLTNLYQQEWVVYSKPPLKHPEKVVDYLGRYTHRVALSNDRLVKLEGNRVTFRWRDSANNNKIKWLTLEAFEFIRRFLLHVLPSQFVKIRYYRDPVAHNVEKLVPRPFLDRAKEILRRLGPWVST